MPYNKMVISDSSRKAQRIKEHYDDFEVGNNNVIQIVISEQFPEYKNAETVDEIPDEIWEKVSDILRAKYEKFAKYDNVYLGIPDKIADFFGLHTNSAPFKDVALDETDKEFIEFAKDVFGADNPKAEGDHQYYMYIPGELKKAEFEEGMKEICERLGCTYELIDQAPEAPSRQYFSENMKLMYPDVKNYDILAKNERKLELAKELFKEAWGQEFDPTSEDDKEDIVLLYNEYMEELREWKPVEVKLVFPEESNEELEEQN